MNIPTDRCGPIALAADHHLRIRARGDWQLRCASGLVWITCTGRLDDRVLRGDEAAQLPAGEWLVGALRASVIEIPACPGTQAGPEPAWRALLSLFARRLLARCGAGFTPHA